MNTIFGVLLCLILVPATVTAGSPNDKPAPLQNVGIDPHLNGQIPLDATFRDESGRVVRLGDYFGQKPVVLALVYYDCPMLCTMVLQGLAAAMRQMPLNAGDQYDALAVSFNPRETPRLAAETRKEYLKQYGRPGGETGWHFLTGAEGDIERLTRAVGFRYAWDPATGQYAHATAIMVVTPEGRLARYFYGVEFSPRDLRLALVEASQHKIGTPVDAVLLFCFHYNPVTGKYGLLITRVFQLAGVAVVFAIAFFIALMLRRERKRAGEAAWANKP